MYKNKNRTQNREKLKIKKKTVRRGKNQVEKGNSGLPNSCGSALLKCFPSWNFLDCFYEFFFLAQKVSLFENDERATVHSHFVLFIFINKM